jgi:hypothetical protein
MKRINTGVPVFFLLMFSNNLFGQSSKNFEDVLTHQEELPYKLQNNILYFRYKQQNGTVEIKKMQINTTLPELLCPGSPMECAEKI